MTTDGERLKILSVVRDTVAGIPGVGVQIYPHVEGEECYGETGCSIFFSMEQLEEHNIDVEDLIAHTDNYVVVRWDEEYFIKKVGRETKKVECIVVPISEEILTPYGTRTEELPHYFVSPENARILQKAVFFEGILKEKGLTPDDWGEIIELAEDDEGARRLIQEIKDYIDQYYIVIELHPLKELPPNSSPPAGWVEVEKRKYYLRK
jgi:hypothetical protein